jgi:hypothetical protein
MKRPSPRRLWFYVTRRLGLRSYFEAPGDGRKYPQIPGKTLLWALLLLSVVGTGLSLPVDVEPYGPQDSEYNAGQRLLRRAVGLLGRRFAD